MARIGLSIQKKFLLLILVIGLIPAALGVVITVRGGQYTFARAMSAALQGRTLEVSKQIDSLCDQHQAALLAIVDRRGGDLEGMRLDAAALGGVEALVRYRSQEDFQVLPVVPRKDNLVERLYQIGPYFETLLATRKIPLNGYFDDLALPDRNGDSGVGWVAIAYAPSYGGLIFFLLRGDFFVQQIRSATIGQDDVVQIYSRRGYMLTSIQGPPKLMDYVEEHLGGYVSEMAGLFSIQQQQVAHPTWHLVGYSTSRRLQRLSADKLSGPPWFVLVSYDMENFLGPQATLVWFSVLAALIWALALMGISVAAARRIVGPIKVLRQQAESMASGDLTARAHVTTHDEIEDLAHTFNTMADKLRQSYERITSFNLELEQKVAERTRDLARANKKLVQTEKYAATGRLAANLAHEINNPLGIIKNYMRLVASNLHLAAGGKRKTDLNIDRVTIINEELDRIARIVRHLLDLHRPVEQRVKSTDVNALLNDLISLMEKGLNNDKIEVKRELDPNLPNLMVAPDLIRQVCLNLLRNAQDAMEKGGVLRVRTETKDQTEFGSAISKVVSISVSDTGTGIKPEDTGRIFDPFFTTKSSDKGTGLGLSISYGIIQMYQGSIDVISEFGKGTTMVVTLPIESTKASSEPFITEKSGEFEPAEEVARN